MGRSLGGPNRIRRDGLALDRWRFSKYLSLGAEPRLLFFVLQVAYQELPDLARGQVSAIATDQLQQIARSSASAIQSPISSFKGAPSCAGPLSGHGSIRRVVGGIGDVGWANCVMPVRGVHGATRGDQSICGIQPQDEPLDHLINPCRRTLNRRIATFVGVIRSERDRGDNAAYIVAKARYQLLKLLYSAFR